MIIKILLGVVAVIAILLIIVALRPAEVAVVIVSGRPAGVGFARKPPLWMKQGDVCEVEIEGIGVLRNPIVDES